MAVPGHNSRVVCFHRNCMSMVPDGPQLDPLKEAGEDTLEPDLNFWKQEWEVVCPEWK